MDTDLPKTAEEYLKLVKQTFSLILAEMDYYSTIERQNDLLRGEAFYEIRPHAPQFQRDFYDMENKIRFKLEELESKLDPNDSLLQTRIKEMQKSFDLK